MYSRGGRGGRGKWRQRGDRHYQGFDNQDSEDPSGYSAYSGSSNLKRSRGRPSRGFGPRQQNNINDDEAGPSRPIKERPPPHLRGKDIE